MHEYLVDQLHTNIRRIIRAMDIHSKSLLKHYGLTGPQLVVLTELGKFKDVSISEVSKKISLSQATVTIIINHLERQGFLQRMKNSVDKRKVHLEFTQIGKELLAQKPGLLQSEFVERFNKLEEWEQHLLVSNMSKIAAMMGAPDVYVDPLLIPESGSSEGKLS